MIINQGNRDADKFEDTYNAGWLVLLLEKCTEPRVSWIKTQQNTRL
jgi:hypothetical protein